MATEEEIADAEALARRDAKRDPRSAEILRALKKAGYSVHMAKQWSMEPGFGYAYFLQFSGVHDANALAHLLKQLFQEHGVRSKEQVWPDPEHQRITSDETGSTAVGFFLYSREAPQAPSKERRVRIRPEKESDGSGGLILLLLVCGLAVLIRKATA